MSEIEINHRFLRYAFVRALLTVAEEVRTDMKDGFQLRRVNDAYATLRILRELFPALADVSVYWIQPEEIYELDWDGNIVFQSKGIARMAARLTTLMREWAEQEKEDE